MRSRKHVMRMAHNASRPAKGKGCALVLVIALGGLLTGFSVIAYALVEVMA